METHAHICICFCPGSLLNSLTLRKSSISHKSLGSYSLWDLYANVNPYFETDMSLPVSLRQQSRFWIRFCVFLARILPDLLVYKHVATLPFYAHTTQHTHTHNYHIMNTNARSPQKNTTQTHTFWYSSLGYSMTTQLHKLLINRWEKKWNQPNQRLLLNLSARTLE